MWKVSCDATVFSWLTISKIVDDFPPIFFTEFDKTGFGITV
jgi:hypothetical protein